MRLRDKGFEVVYRGPEEPLPEVEVDANAIDRAVANLLDNAVKYSNGDRRILLTLDRVGDEARISVADHCIGIPREELDRIFERFHRVSTGLVHDVKGSGLGLSLVRHIAENHGGRVTGEEFAADAFLLDGDDEPLEQLLAWYRKALLPLSPFAQRWERWVEFRCCWAMAPTWQ